jgi:hypothetical protein
MCKQTLSLHSVTCSLCASPFAELIVDDISLLGLLGENVDATSKNTKDQLLIFACTFVHLTSVW